MTKEHLIQYQLCNLRIWREHRLPGGSRTSQRGSVRQWMISNWQLMDYKYS